ncbi:MAG: tetratricopeptide repeat protein [Candidatus Latescibacteria bacterium]|nr:tetratricopeptide repeat protein [Candidatus Latescibacterota bacterium]
MKKEGFVIRISGLFQVRAGGWALMLALSAGGCATTRYETGEAPPPVPARPLARADTLVLKKAQARPLAQVDTLEVKKAQPVALTEIDSLKALLSGQVQKMADLEVIHTELSGKVAVLNDRIRALEDRLQASLSPPQPPARSASGRRKKAAPPPSPSNRVKTVYQAAFRDFEARHFENALRAFSEALAAAPKDDLADNAQYWIGECHYGLGHYTQAIKEFQKVFTYSDTEKDDDAQFKIARCYIDLGDQDKATIELKRLTVDYPESEYVRRAEGLLRDLQDQKRQRTK